MANFTGSECIICKEKFEENDDIVVCPNCGTPYHRDCYNKEGECVNTTLHEKNESWSKYNIRFHDEAENIQHKKCEFCGTDNNPDSLICKHCGASLAEEINSNTEKSEQRKNNNINGFNFDLQDKYCGMDPEEILENNVSISDAAEFVGSNAQYYLLHFKQMKETGKKITINIVCILFPQFYFANRKMWLEAIITIILTTLFSIPSMIYTMSVADESLKIAEILNLQGGTFEIITRISNYASMAIHILTCIFANWLYYRHMLRKAHSIKNQCGIDGEEVKEKLKKSGGTSFLYILIAFAVEMLIATVITCLIINI